MREGWEYKTFGDVGSFQRGKSIQKADFVEKGLPCIHYGQIHTRFGVSVDTHLSEIPIEVYNKSIIASYGDVIIAITSEDLEGSCKSTAWLGNYDIAVSSHAAVYKHSLYPKFIVYYLRSNCFYNEKQKYARGFKVMEIKTTDIAKIPIPVPPLSEQQRIVSELDLLSSIIEKKKAQLKEYDKLAQSIFYDMFGDPVTNEKGWEVKRLEDVCEATSSKRIFADEYTTSGIPFYRGKEITEKSKDMPLSIELYISEERYNELKKIGIPQIGDILITAVGTIGNIWVVNDNTPFYFKDGNIIWLRNIRMQNSVYFKFILEKLIEIYKQEMVRGAAYNALTIVNLKGMPVPLPPLSLQQSFASKIEAIERQKALIQQSITETETLFNSRMDYYFD